MHFSYVFEHLGKKKNEAGDEKQRGRQDEMMASRDMTEAHVDAERGSRAPETFVLWPPRTDLPTRAAAGCVDSLQGVKFHNTHKEGCQTRMLAFRFDFRL